MGDITLNNVASGYNRRRINTNFQTIEDSINDDILHNKGGNNQMFQDIDANGYSMYNVREAILDHEVVNLLQLNNGLSGITDLTAKIRDRQTSTEGQTVFNLSSFTYSVGNNSIDVYINGVKQYVGESYIETDEDTITFTEGLKEGDEVELLINAAPAQAYDDGLKDILDEAYVNVSGDTMQAPLAGPDAVGDDDYVPKAQVEQLITDTLNSFTNAYDIATSGQTTVSLSSLFGIGTYRMINVYVNGVHQVNGVAYNISGDTITFVEGLDEGDLVNVTAGVFT